MAEKPVILRGLIAGTIYDMLPRGSVYNIYVDNSTTLADKLAEVIASLNGKVSQEQLAEIIESVLAEAKASGEFDGEDGEDGAGIVSVTIEEV